VADYHVLTGTEDGNSFVVVHHIPIPSGAANRAGVAYRTALINSGYGGKTVLPDGDGTGGTISAAEKTQVQAGALFEVVDNFPTNPAETAPQLQVRLDARHNALVTEHQDRITKRLTYFGYVRNVP
jgi:hypothetical protein